MSYDRAVVETLQATLDDAVQRRMQAEVMIMRCRDDEEALSRRFAAYLTQHMPPLNADNVADYPHDVAVLGGQDRQWREAYDELVGRTPGLVWRHEPLFRGRSGGRLHFLLAWDAPAYDAPAIQAVLLRHPGVELAVPLVPDAYLGREFLRLRGAGGTWYLGADAFGSLDDGLRAAIDTLHAVALNAQKRPPGG